LNKRDLCSDAELDRAAELVAALQPDATTIPTSFSAVGPDRLVGIDAFDASELATLPGWKRALADADHAGGEADHDGHGGTDHAGGKADHAHRHPDEVYGVSSFTYRRRRPFHPERLAETLRSLPADVVRSKGTLWVAGSDQRQQVGQAGRSVRVTAQGPWIASRPPVERDMLRSNRPELSWHDDHGDRETAYVVIGTDLETDSIADRLDAALVTDEEWERVRAEDELSGVEEFPTTPGDEVVLRAP
jgi:G3E family GTPase